MQKLFIMVTSIGSCSYFLRVTFHEAGTIGVIKSNMPESTFLKTGMMRDFALKFTTSLEEEEFEFNLDASSDSGKFNLYAKQCTKPSNCGFLNGEILSNKKLFGDDKVYAEESNTTRKEMKVKVVCGKLSAFSVDRIREDLTVYNCVLDVGIYAKETPKVGSNFNVLVVDSNQHLIVTENHFRSIRLRNKEQLMYQFNLHRKQFNVLSKLSFRFDLLYGRASVYISKTNKAPCGDHEALSAVLSPNVPRNLVFKRSTSPDKKLKGSYYICIVGEELSSLNFAVHPVAKRYNIGVGELNRVNVNDLSPDSQVLAQFTKKVDTVYFSFVANLDKEAGEAIRIHLTPIKGSFRIFVSSNEKLPTPFQTYWNTIGTGLEIKPTDSNYVAKGRYVVGVQVIRPENLEGESKNKWKCMFSYTFSERHIKMRAGMPIIGDLNVNRSKTYFKIEIPETTSNLTFIKSSIYPNIFMYLTFNSSNGYPTRETASFIAAPYQTGFFVTKEDLKKFCKPVEHNSHCDAYITVESQTSSEYNLQYVLDNGPFTVPHGNPMRLPLFFTTDYPLHFIYHIDHQKDVDFEVSSDYQPIEFFLRKVRERKNHSGYTFPDRSINTTYKAHGDDRSNGSLLIKKNITGQRSILLISLYKKHVGYFERVYGRTDPKQMFLFINNGLLELSSNDKILHKGVSVTASVTRGEWKYFKISHATSDLGNLIINSEVELGQIEVYVSKGLEDLPSDTNFLKKKIEGSTDVIMISKEDVGLGETLGGNYLVGVKGITLQSTFHLLYRQDAMNIFTLADGVPSKFNMEYGQRYFVEYKSDGRVADIVINFKSRRSRVNLFAVSHNDTDHSKVKLPTPDDFSANAGISTEGGYGRLVISRNSSAFCTYCTIVALVETTGDTLTFVATKKGPGSLISLIEGKSFVGRLGKGESQTFAMIVPYNETYLSIDLKISSGNLTFYYGMKPDFLDPRTYFKVKEKTKDEFFNINFGKISTYFRKIFHSKIVRYLKVWSETVESEYTLTMVSDKTLTELNSMVAQHALLPVGGMHYYYMHTFSQEQIDISFHLRNVIGMETAEFDTYVRDLPAAIRLYQATNFQQVEDRNSDYELESRYDLFQHELKVTAVAKTGYLIVAIKNVLNRPISYSIENNRFGIRRLTSSHFIADYVPQYMKKEFYIDTENAGMLAKVEINQCLGVLNARYAYVDSLIHKQGSEKHTEYSEFLNEQFDQQYIKVKEGKKIEIQIEKSGSQVNNHIHGSEYNRRFDETIPSIYSVNVELHLENVADRGVNDASFVVGDLKKYGDVEIFTDSDQSVKFKGLTFHDDFIKKHGETYILINYTLFMSKDKDMMNFMKYCNLYRIDQAEEALLTKSHYVYSVQEYYALNMSDARPITPIHSIRPHSLSFGGIYYGVIVADLRFWEKSVKFAHFRTTTASLGPTL